MKSSYSSAYTVTIGDINYGGHLGNDRALVIFQDARLYFLQKLGFSEMDIGAQCGMIMVESGVRYLREVFLHDVLETSVGLGQIKAKKFILEYSVVRPADDQTVLRGFTSFLAFDYRLRKVVALPELFRNRLDQFFRDSASCECPSGATD
ncbi:MAG TPA: thioesterase family protein [Desulfopila sp.]|nr:thioesterase family protein [Desulfopila sp.]